MEMDLDHSDDSIETDSDKKMEDEDETDSYKDLILWNLSEQAEAR